MVSLTAWARCILKEYPRYFLGGSRLENVDVFTETLRAFWRKFRDTHQNHPAFTEFTMDELGYVIPYAIHGDDGRGKNFIPTLVYAFQMLIHPCGMEYTNTPSPLEWA